MRLKSMFYGGSGLFMIALLCATVLPLYQLRSLRSTETHTDLVSVTDKILSSNASLSQTVSDMIASQQVLLKTPNTPPNSSHHSRALSDPLSKGALKDLSELSIAVKDIAMVIEGVSMALTDIIPKIRNKQARRSLQGIQKRLAGQGSKKITALYEGLLQDRVYIADAAQRIDPLPYPQKTLSSIQHIAQKTQQELKALRTWLTQHTAAGQPIRRAKYLLWIQILSVAVMGILFFVMLLKMRHAIRRLLKQISSDV